MSKWRSEYKYLLRYATAGVLNTVVGMGSIFLLTVAGVSSFTANFAGFALGLMLNFTTSRRFVFRSNHAAQRVVLRFLLAFSLAFIVNQLVLHFLLSYTSIHVLLAQAAAIASYAITLYTLSRTFVFTDLKKRDKVNDA